MRRTKTLRLQQPEPGDIYNSETITSNTEKINSIMGKLGGYIAERSLDLVDVLSLRSGFAFDTTPGRLTVYGNGLAHIEVNVKTTATIGLNNLGMTGNGSSTAGVVVADVFPEFGTAIAQPLTSGGFGTAVSGYIAPNTTRIVFRLVHGYFSGSIPVGTTVQLTGLYPLAELPQGIGLEQMTSTFDNLLHVRNLNRIDTVASKLKTLRGFQDTDDKIQPTSLATISRAVLYRNSNGLVSMDMTFKLRTDNPGNISGDIGNTTVARIADTNWRPDRNTKLVSTNMGILICGEVAQDGDIVLTSYAGNSTPINSEISLAGDWMYRGN